MLTIEKIKLPLRVVWKLSRNQTKIKENFIVTLDEKYQGEVAPNIRYGETPELVQQQFNEFKASNIDALEELDEYFKVNQVCHSLMFALEAAFVAREADREGKSTAQYLGLNSVTKMETSFSVPIMDLEGVPPFVKSVAHFPALKIKVNKAIAQDMVATVVANYSGPIRIDGNEAWDSLEEYLEFEKTLAGKKVQFIEEPFKAQDTHLYEKLFSISKYPIMADESVEDTADFEQLKKMFHLVNVKLMKAGGYRNAVKLLKAAREHGMQTMIGCMIETSLGIRSAMELAELCDYFDLDGFLLLQKDPFNLVVEKNGILSY
jgi:L-alanine-DL-glutamate epimerase-like enolase superfamily enzyme